jgi:hypothetical protein
MILWRPPYANGELLHIMFAKEQRKAQEKATIAINDGAHSNQ